MTPMDCADVWEVLEEYRRRELSAEAMAAVEAHLAGCPACRRLRDESEALAIRIRALPRPTASPARVRAVRGLERAPVARRRRRWPWVAAAAAVVLVALGWAAWLRFAPDRPAGALEALLLSGVAEHRRIAVLAEGSLDVADPAPLFREVERLTGFPPPAAFAGVGELRLRDARATVLAGRKTAAAALHYPTSRITTYFVLPGADLPMPSERRVQIEQYRPYMREVSGLNVVYWKQKDLAYLMVSELDQEGSKKLYLTMRKAL
jgi:anti-sigma factor RsiW